MQLRISITNIHKGRENHINIYKLEVDKHNNTDEKQELLKIVQIHRILPF